MLPFPSDYPSSVTKTSQNVAAALRTSLSGDEMPSKRYCVVTCARLVNDDSFMHLIRDNLILSRFNNEIK